MAEIDLAMNRPRPLAQQRAEAGDAVAAALDPARFDAEQDARENDEAVGWCAPTCSGIWRIPLVWRRALLLFGIKGSLLTFDTKSPDGR